MPLELPFPSPAGNLPHQHASIAVVDDEPANVRLLERLLQRAGYTQVLGLTDPRQLVAQCSTPTSLPDLILLDLTMPVLDGYEVLTLLRTQLPATHYLPVIVLTADITPEAKRRALALGANDFLTKPFNPTEVVLRVRNLLTTRSLYSQLQQHSVLLEQRVRERTTELELARLELLQRLAVVSEYRDDETHEHTQRVGALAEQLAAAMGLPHDEVELIGQVGPLHDIGKLGIPDRILLKPGPLTSEEFRVMQTHTTLGARILGAGEAPVIRLAEQVARAHHERWNGEGYPDKLRGEVIPLAARIVSVADVYDALTHARPYKEAWPLERAVAEIAGQKGRQFDPQVVEAFLSIASPWLLGQAA